MSTNHNELPEVNQFIKENNLIPCFAERWCGSVYDSTNDMTYIVVKKNNTYLTFSSHYFAHRKALEYNSLLVICRGKINE